jgi:hypothetical protein
MPPGITTDKMNGDCHQLIIAMQSDAMIGSELVL